MYEQLASLVSYPDAGLLLALDHCIQALAPEVPEAATLLEHFREVAGELGQDGLEETYIQVFEMQAEAALYIGHQLFGEDWRRGTFMACLKERYQECGFSMRRGTAGPRERHTAVLGGGAARTGKGGTDRRLHRSGASQSAPGNRGEKDPVWQRFAGAVALPRRWVRWRDGN